MIPIIPLDLLPQSVGLLRRSVASRPLSLARSARPSSRRQYHPGAHTTTGARTTSGAHTTSGARWLEAALDHTHCPDLIRQEAPLGSLVAFNTKA